MIVYRRHQYQRLGQPSMEASTERTPKPYQTEKRSEYMIGLHTKKSKGLRKQLIDPENYVPDQSARSVPSRRFQPTGDGGGGGGWSNFELLSKAEVYLGWREDSMALAMSWLKVDEARTEGRKLT
jgi:hypothetical protein